MTTCPHSTRRGQPLAVRILVLWGALLGLSSGQLARSETSSPKDPSEWQRRQIAAVVKRSAQDLRKQSQSASALGKPERAAYLLASAYVLEPSNDTLFEVARHCKSAGLDAEAQAISQRVHAGELAPDDAAQLRAAASAPPSPEQEAAQAEALRSHIRNATRSFDAGAFPLAAQELSLAYTTQPLPRLLFNAAQSYRRTRQPELAYALLEKYLAAEQSDADQSGSSLKREARNTQKELLATALTQPLYRRPWFWGVLGVATAVIVGAAVATDQLVPHRPAADAGYQTLDFGLLGN